MGSSSSKGSGAGGDNYKSSGAGASGSSYPVAGSTSNANSPPAYEEKPQYEGQAPLPPPASQYGMSAAPPPYQAQQQFIHTQDAFDAGARFGAGSTRHVPPPPPGIMPNMAQQASAQGHQVQVGQRQSTLMDGTGSGGAVVW